MKFKHWFLLFIYLLNAGQSIVISQIACSYSFGFRKDIPYQPLPNDLSVRTLVSGANIPDNPDDSSPTDEDYFKGIKLGFSFQFNGKYYDEIGVCTNGWIWFGSNTPVKAGGIVLPYINVLEADHALEGVIAALNGDLDGRWSAVNASIKTNLSGTAPLRKFIVEWRNFKTMNETEGTGYCGENRNRFDFQVILEEQTNRITIAYNANYCWQGFANLFQVGLRGSVPGDVHSRYIPPGENAWERSLLGMPGSTAALRSSSPTAIPPPNARFIFSPVEKMMTVWTGISTNWFDPDNWSGKMVPTRCHDVLIQSGKSYYPVLRGKLPAECSSLTIENGGNLHIEKDYNSFLTLFGNLHNDGEINNNSNSFITLAGGSGKKISGEGDFFGADIFITGQSSYSLESDLILRNLNINQNATLNLNKNTLDVYALNQLGNLNQGEGILVIEGDPASVRLNDSTFDAGEGTTFFGSGEIWSDPVDQQVPSMRYHHLWIRTNKGHNVRIGNGDDLFCRDLLFYNPDEPGGIAITGSPIFVEGNFKLGMDGKDGTDLHLNYPIFQTTETGKFNMERKDNLLITHSSSNKQPVISGFGRPEFKGNMTYKSDQEQTMLRGYYNNLSVSGEGVRNTQGNIDLHGIMRVHQGTLMTSDSLTLRSDSMASSLILQEPGSHITGDVKIERYIRGKERQSVLFSSPFHRSLFSDYSSSLQTSQNIENNMHEWNYNTESESKDSFPSWNQIADPSKTMQIGKAYLTDIEGGSKLVGGGGVNSGVLRIPLDKTAISNPYQLVGNPYPSPIDWNKAILLNPNLISPAMHKLASGRFNGNYASWLPLGLTSGIGINGASKYVAIQEGFFVKAHDTLNLNDDCRAAVLNTNLSDASPVISYLRLSLSDDKKTDETVIYYHEKSSNNKFEEGADVEKFLPISGNFSCFSIKDSVNLAIHAREKINSPDTIPLGLEIEKSGYYEIRLSEIKNFPSTAMIYLEDRKNKVIKDIRRNMEYKVQLEAGKIMGRFFLLYKPGILIETVHENCGGEKGKIIFSNQSKTNWKVTVSNSNEDTVAYFSYETGKHELRDLLPDDYKIHYSLPEQNLEIDEWVQLFPAEKIEANLRASSYCIAPGVEVFFRGNAKNAANFLWNFGDGMLVSGDTIQSHIFRNAGKFRVMLTVSGNQCADTASVIITVSEPTGIDQINASVSGKFIIFPNPAADQTKVQFNNPQVYEETELLLVDMQGKVIRDYSIGKANPFLVMDIPLNDLPTGNYQVILKAKGHRAVNTLSVVGHRK